MSLVDNISEIEAFRAERVQVAIWQIHPDPSGLVMDAQGGLTAAERDRISADKFRSGPTLLQDWTEIVTSPDARARNDYTGDIYRTPEKAWVLGPHIDSERWRDMVGGYLLVARYPDGQRYVTYLPLYWRNLVLNGQDGLHIRWCSTQIPSITELDLLPPESAFWGTHRFTGMWLAGGNRGRWGYGTEFFGGLVSPRDISQNFRHFVGDQWYRPGTQGPIAGVPTGEDLQAAGVGLRQHRVEGVAVYAPDFSTGVGGSLLRGDVALRTLQDLGSETARRILGIGNAIDLSWWTEGAFDPPTLDWNPGPATDPEPDVTYVPPPAYNPPGDIVPEAGDEVEGEPGDGDTGRGVGLAVAGIAAAALLLGGKK
ncbi:MAG: hypothetical protein K0U62_11505 [Actinomycetia bacterium]|nr:hypothetical protein [Actinomycetes bacterium]